MFEVEAVPESSAVIAAYNSHVQVESAVKELQKSGFDMNKLSIVGNDHHTEEHLVGYYNDGKRHWGKLAIFWNGLLFGGCSSQFLIGVRCWLLARWRVGSLPLWKVRP